ncbi:GFA family protein [bacterium]|nr:GFA family protein [bacterium]
MEKYRGSCLCKQTTFEFTGTVAGFYLCHCSRCRKQTGSAHASNVFFKEAIFNWLSGEENVSTFQLGETRFIKSFCKNCGSALPRPSQNGRLLVPAGSLDTKLDIKPTAHIFMASKAQWDCHLEEAPKYEQLPDS